MANAITIEDLHGYLDEALSEEASSRVERALRESSPLRTALARLVEERERGEHSLGAIWRRQRITCPSREELGNLVMNLLEEARAEYIHFHIRTIGCGFCQANLNDLMERSKEMKSLTQTRRQKMFASSAGYLPKRK
ncbi:MAG TPA: hypothetical protein PKA06_12285 [Gemmatales bacterium]|nr:hypothetical protein [Gemmatales bacterium]